MRESELIAKAQQKDQPALEQLYKMHFKALYVFVRCKVDSNQRAEDITAESFVRAFENIGKFRAQSSFKSWLFTIARNQVIDWYTSKDKETNLEAVERVPEEEARPENTSAAKIAKSLLEALKGSYREVLELRFIGNLSIKETAASMGTSEGNVKVLQNRALKKAQILARELHFI